LSELKTNSFAGIMFTIEFKYSYNNLNEPQIGRNDYNMPKTRAGKLLQFKHYSTDAPI